MTELQKHQPNIREELRTLTSNVRWSSTLAGWTRPHPFEQYHPERDKRRPMMAFGDSIPSPVPPISELGDPRQQKIFVAVVGGGLADAASGIVAVPVREAEKWVELSQVLPETEPVAAALAGGGIAVAAAVDPLRRAAEFLGKQWGMKIPTPSLKNRLEMRAFCGEPKLSPVRPRR